MPPETSIIPSSKNPLTSLNTSEPASSIWPAGPERVGESQRKFISNISHDFRSPLTSIKGYVEAILDGTIPVEIQDRYLHIVLSETERLEKLTKGLLTLNTFDDNGYLMEMSDFDINEVIRRTLETFEGRCNERGIRFPCFSTRRAFRSTRIWKKSSKCSITSSTTR